MSQIKDLQSEIVAWADGIIPDRLPEDTFSKMLEEVSEWAERPCDGHEAADVFILMLDVCHLTGIDIEKALKFKMRINYNRQWEIHNGTLRHIKSSGHTEGARRSPLDNSPDDKAPDAGRTHFQCDHDSKSNLQSTRHRRYNSDEDGNGT